MQYGLVVVPSGDLCSRISDFRKRFPEDAPLGAAGNFHRRDIRRALR
ncbi:MAG: hypothetical protein ACXWLQ_02245 [Rhizomicrobium sp.]